MTDWTDIIMGIAVLTLGTVLIVVAVTVGVSFARAGIARREQQALERLVARYDELVSGIEAREKAAGDDLADLRARVREIERVLKEVE